jgi:ATP-binding cassette subfamily F protein uup
MPVLDANDLHKSYGASTLLDGVTLTIRRGERVGLVGANGSGKSTLSKILGGIEDPDKGVVSRRRGARIEYLAQEPNLPAGATVLDVTLSGLGEWAKAKREYERIAGELAKGTGNVEELLARQSEAAAEVERLGGWERTSEAETILSKLGMRDVERTVDNMSGGEKRRVALARLLVSKPDLAILDEPTNHLDAETIEWLEGYLVDENSGALLLITHDRWMLDRVVQRTIEIEAGKLYSYDGGWEDYLIARSERMALAERTEANRQNFLRKEIEWLRRQPKARTGKQKARIQRAEAAQEAEPMKGPNSFELRVTGKRLGATILEAHDLAVDIAGRRLVENLTLHLTRGERIGIIGRNGAGKTTLLQCLLGQREAAAGRVVQGKNTSFAYFDQARSGLDAEKNVFDTVVDGRPSVMVGGEPVSSYAYLDRFRLGGDKMRQPVGTLSGGERARTVLAKLLLEPANVLVLDEPTNDLDVTTLGALEEMLVGMGGSALIVSHDRYFLDRVATSLLVVHGDGRVVHYAGGYSSYTERRAEEDREKARQKAEEQAQRKSPDKAQSGAASGKKGLTYAEQKELKGLLEKVEKAGERVKQLEAELGDPALYTERRDAVSGLQADLASAKSEAERLENRWLELEERREGAS